MKTERAAPRASVLIESMRDIGYSMETALADIVDNAITAGAGTVTILTDTSIREPRLAILDDGVGMDAKELLTAMTPGSRNPLEDRHGSDLGRFGLGLKTASFSQCRCLTVVSRKNGVTACARWDLDYVAEKDDWLVQIPSTTAGIPWADTLGSQGTLILWEKIDRVSTTSSDEKASPLVREISSSIQHLELVFHRYLAGERGLKRVDISVNNEPLKPFDPFHSSHPATISGPVEKIRVSGHEVTVQTFTLPHHTQGRPADWEKYAGPAGYVKNQGFYVYRAKRLIIHGTWFGLARQMELTKLARVRIDMPNGLDAQWKIDIKKASAHPPPQVRERLRHIIATIGATSKHVYTARGTRLVSDSRLPVWVRVQDKNEISYRISQDHPVLTDFMADLPDDKKRDFLRIMEMTGAALPVDALFADISGQPEKVAGGAMSAEAQQHVLITTFRHLSQSGVSERDIIAMLQATEPFRSHWKRRERFSKR